MAVPQFLPEKPGKIIAVHVAFESRAAQRGRWPKTPSYFLKATSTLAESGGVVERPAGTELLAFEGEIALIIGKPARNVTLDVEDRASLGVDGTLGAPIWEVGIDHDVHDAPRVVSLIAV